MKLTGFERI